MTRTALARRLGRSGVPVSPIGLGCWAIGGPLWAGEQPRGWGEVDDQESTRAIRRALDLGVTLFDTADVYGAGHSERVLGRALAGDRRRVLIATKFGNTFDEASRQMSGVDVSAGYVRSACEASLKRLGTDYIDLYQLHVGDLPEEQALVVRQSLEELVDDGLIHSYGWSTDDPARARLFGAGAHGMAVQHGLNVFADAGEMLDACHRLAVASINRSPLAMGLLTGKFQGGSRLPMDDVRGREPAWMRWFKGGRPVPEYLARLEAIREVLTSGGRTLAQGALAWIWGRSDLTIPIPGFRTVAQVEENAGALRFAPLAPVQMAEIEELLDRA
jgi:aryl-alcohol dehydrogenase-like predicted oxidoreductase